MAVEPEAVTRFEPVAGIRLATAYCGLRKTERDDVLLLEMAAGSRVAVSLTRNLFCAAPVTVVKEHIARESPRYLIINAGNANAGTGNAGLQAARMCCRAVAEQAGVSEKTVLPFSTGVIGQALAVEKIQAALPKLQRSLDERSWLAAARAIMTTDTRPKIISKQIDTGNGAIHITGIAKGAGMICPNMATMLSFIATDAELDQAELEQLHLKLVNRSFNRISVDGDTSTNDACVLMATGKAGKIQSGSKLWMSFEQALDEVYGFLAQAIIRDGEGATKFVTVNVSNGATASDCESVARTIAHSPLVKTALFASDANWGRILAAVGRAGVELDIDKVGLTVNGVVILEDGRPSPDYTEDAGSAAFELDEIEITVDLNVGTESYQLWTTDLSHEYVRINAEYRT